MNAVYIVASLIAFCVIVFALLLWKKRNAIAPGLSAGAAASGLAVEWTEIQPHLPEDWSFVSDLSAEVAGTLKPASSVYSEALVRGLAQAAPSLLTAVRGGQTFRMIGPPEALKALDAGTVDFLRDTSGKQLMTLRGADGKFAHQARVENVGNEVRGAAAAACIFQVLSVVTAQYYLHDINKNLTQISDKISEVLGKLDDQRWAKLRAAQDIVDEVNRDVAQNSGPVSLPHQHDTIVEFWTRMSDAETSLREVIRECDHDYERHQAKFVSELCERKSGADWVRKRTHQRTDIEHWNECLKWHQTVGEVQMAAVRAMVLWYQVVLTRDSLTQQQKVPNRYAAMVLFVTQRAEHMDRWWRDRDILLAQEGKTFTDGVKDVASALLCGATLSLADPAGTTERRHLKSASELASVFEARRIQVQPLLQMVRAQQSPSTFYIRASDPGSDRRFDVLVAEQQLVS
jgi:hypothetical protein